MDYLLQTLELIYKKYRALIVPFYGLIALFFMWTVYSHIKQVQARNYIVDASFLNRQVEKIQNNVKDFKTADIPYINMVCASYGKDYHMQRRCYIINKFVENNGFLS